MSDDLFARFGIEPHERNPLRAAQREMRRPLPRRFYEKPHLEKVKGGFALMLDGRPARTPAQRPFVVPTRPAGEAVVAEWAAQVDTIDPATMPMTRIVNSSIDGVATEKAAVRAEIVKFAASDLVCYRATDPQSLVELEAFAWDPVLAWTHDFLGADLVVSHGIAFAQQPPAALAAIERAVAKVEPTLALACLHTMTTLTGSAVLALSVAYGFLPPEAAWEAAHVDEDFQIRGWGEDAEAAARRAGRWREMAAAARLFTTLALVMPWGGYSQIR